MQLRFAALMQRPDVDALLDELTGEEWDEWRAFYSLEPWGCLTDDVRFGLILSFIAARNGQELNPSRLYAWQQEPVSQLTEEQKLERISATLRGRAAVVVEADGVVTRRAG